MESREKQYSAGPDKILAGDQQQLARNDKTMCNPALHSYFHCLVSKVKSEVFITLIY